MATSLTHALLVVLSTSLLSVEADDGITVLSDEEYYALPKLFTMDHYEECMVQRDGAFCLASFDLTAPTQSPLFDVLKNISSFPRVYYDHTKLHRGLCVTKSCRQYLTSSSRDLQALRPALEACVNQSIHREYGLEARVSEIKYCKSADEEIPLDVYDYAFAAVVATLLVLNVAGSLYEAVTTGDKSTSWLAAFSLRLNWHKLTVTREDDFGDPRLNRLKSIQGFRTLSMFFVILGHVMLIPLSNVPPDRTRFVEQMPYYFASTLLYSGYFFMQTFIVMGSFLLAYNLKIYMETRKNFDWSVFLMGIVQRFLRLVPAYMLMVFFVATWASRLTSGPLCPISENERVVCREKWWLQLLFLHNVVRASDMCMGQTWYLAVDMQLFVFGLLVLKLLWHRPQLTRPVLGLALMLSTVGQFCLMYFFDLKPPQLMQTPESLLALFKNERSFWLVYTTFQGNVQGYLVGLILGLEYYRMEQKGEYISSKKWFRVVYRLCFPVGFCWMLLIQPFLRSELPPLYVALYATIDRFFFAVLVALLILGIFCRVDNFYRGIMEWRGWQALGRLSFSALLLHILTYFWLSCSKENPRTLTVYGSCYDWVGTVVLTYLLAVPLTLMVEYPFHTIQKLLLTPTTKKEKVQTDHNGNIVRGKSDMNLEIDGNDKKILLNGKDTDRKMDANGIVKEAFCRKTKMNLNEKKAQ